MSSEKTFTLIVDTPPKYRAFILRIQAAQNQAAALDYRFTLEDVDTHNRFNFYDLKRLVRFLQGFTST